MKKQDSREDNIQTEPLVDLQLTNEQAEETKAGREKAVQIVSVKIEHDG